MKEITLEILDNMLNLAHVIVKCNPISLFYLNDLSIIKNIEDLITILDLPNENECKRYAILDYFQSKHHRFSFVELKHNPFQIDLNGILFNKYQEIQRIFFSQKDIARLISNNTNYDVIILILIDGLSYEDCRNLDNISPCFVNGATLTEVDFKNIIGNPTIATRLYDKHFFNRLCFSYWNRDNPLTNNIFFAFDKDTQMKQVDEFDEIIFQLKNKEINRSYIQILINGLDQVSHKNWDRPPIKSRVECIFKTYIPKLRKIILDKNLCGKIYAVSDHGVWWRPKIDSIEKYQIITDKRANAKRYLSGNLIRDKVRHVTCYGKRYSLLKYPYIFRDYKKNEWGCHGGISYYESIVPFYQMEVG